MTDEAARLLELAMLLPPKERAQLAARLVDSINTIAAAEAAWNSEAELRARRAVANEVGRVFYLGRAPVPLRFEQEAEADLERAVSRLGAEPARIDALLDELTEALQRIHVEPCGFGAEPALPDHLGVRRLMLSESPYRILYVPLAKELRVLAIAHRFLPPGDTEISIAALATVEDWLARTGWRVATFLAPGAALAVLGH